MRRPVCSRASRPSNCSVDTMAGRELSRTTWRTIEAIGDAARPRCQRTAVRLPRRNPLASTTRCLSTSATKRAELTPNAFEKFTAAPPINFEQQDAAKAAAGDAQKIRLDTLRIVPASPSYFSAKPTFNDDLI